MMDGKSGKWARGRNPQKVEKDKATDWHMIHTHVSGCLKIAEYGNPKIDFTITTTTKMRNYKLFFY